MTGCRQREVEARWGMPFFDVLADLAAQDLNMRDAGRAIGYETWNQYVALRQVLDRHPDQNPWAHHHSVPAQYTLDTGESFKDAVVRLSKTHTVTEAARAIGYTGDKPAGNLRYAMKAHGIEATFQQCQSCAMPRIPRTMVSPEEVDEFISRLSRGQTTRFAAYAMGRDRRTLMRATMQRKNAKE